MTNRKTTKRALLSSILALVLCFAMLLGTTFAWFTDTATTNVSTIQAGTLDVQLLDAEGHSLEGQTLTWQKAEDGAQQEILWEPGCTYNLQPITIKNGGNLALKYKIVITGIQGDAELNNAIEWTIKFGDEQAFDLSTERSLGAGDSDVNLIISGHMKEAAGNEYQGKTIDGIAITVYAAQNTVEYDSSTNQYDANAEYDVTDAWTGGTDENGNQTEPSQDQQPELNQEDGLYHIDSAAEFINYINAVVTSTSNARFDYAKAILDKSIDLNGYTFTRNSESYMFSGQFDGNGHTVSNFSIKRTDGQYYTSLFGYLSGAGNYVKNLTVKNAVVTSNGKQASAVVSSVYDGAIVDNCHAINCTVSAVKKAGAVVGYVENSSVTNCTAKDCTILISENDSAEVSLFGFKGTNSTMTGNVDKGGNSLRYNVTGEVSYVAPGVLLVGSTYEISSADGMFWFAEQVNVKRNDFNGKTIKLADNIDLNNRAWTPVGQTGGPHFKGTFDGNTKTIKNLSINETGLTLVSDADGLGLFGWLQGTVKDLTIDGVTINGSRRIGAVAGVLEFGSIDKCTVKNATLTGTHKDAERCGDKVGGVVGMVQPNTVSVTNCMVENSTIKAARDAGQVIGMAYPSRNTLTNNTATSVEVSVTTGCSDGSAGANIKNEVIGRQG